MNYQNPYEDLPLLGQTTINYTSEDLEPCEVTLINDENDLFLIKSTAWNRLKHLLTPTLVPHIVKSLLKDIDFPVFPVDTPYIRLISQLIRKRNEGESYVQRLVFEFMRIERGEGGRAEELWEEVKRTSLARLPGNWGVLEVLETWPYEEEYDYQVPERYVKSLGKTSDSLSVQGLRLYETYRTSPSDPVSFYLTQITELTSFTSSLLSTSSLRLELENWKYGGVTSHSLFSTYQTAVSTFTSKASKLQSHLIRPPLSPDYLSHISRLMGVARLESLVAPGDESRRKYAIQLLESVINTIEPFIYQYGDVAAPMMEGLLLTRFLMVKMDKKLEKVQNFPLLLEDCEMSENIEMAAFVSHTQSQILQNFSNFLVKRLKSLRNALQTHSSSGLKLHLPTYTPLTSIHTIGEMAKEQAEIEQKRIDMEELELLFPSYEGNSWDKVESRAKEELEVLFEMWEFAVGGRKQEEMVRFVSALGECRQVGDWKGKVMVSYLKKAIENKEIEEGYDYYKDPNPGEIRLLYTVLVKLMVRIAEILTEYPSAPVLGEIMIVAKKTLDLEVLSTSLMQAVTCVEQVLGKCQEWEDYASAQVSLRPVLQPLYALVKRWRQIEISTWTDLLNQRKREFVRQDLKLWTGFVLVAEDHTTDSKGLYETLETFIRSSSLALFPHRLSLLKPYFEKSPVFRYIYHYFMEFMQEFEEIQKELTGDVAEQVAEAIKLTKFDLSNHHALKDSIVRQHRHLHKLLRTYSATLGSSFQDCVLAKVRQQYLHNLLEQPLPLLDSLPTPSPSDIDELIDSIFSRLELLKSNIGEVSLRRKALSDLFTALHDLKLPTKPPSNSAFYTQPILHSIPPASYTSSERYYYRSIDRLSLLQQLGTLSTDISASDREKCMHYAVVLVWEMMRVRGETIRDIEEREDWEWVERVQMEADKRFFEDLQRYFIGEIKEKPIKSTINSTESALKYLQTRPCPNFPLSKSVFPLNSSSLTPVLTRFHSISKLTYILTSIFLSLLHNGFCKPPTSSPDSDSGPSELIEGTGMSDGTGLNDITKELEDQQQLESLRNEEKTQENEGKSEEKEEDVMDMEADFEGKEDEVGSEVEGSEEDREGKAEGNERLLEGVDDKFEEAKQDEVRNSAKPEITEEGTKNSELEHKKTEIEDFEFHSNQSDSQEMQSNASGNESEEACDPLDVDKMSEKSEEEVSESEAMEGKEEEQKQEMEGKEGEERMDVDGESSQEEVEMDTRYRNRDFMPYKNKAYGVKDRPANTADMAEKREEEEGQSEEVEGGDIISRLRKEWKKRKTDPGERVADQTEQAGEKEGQEEVKPDIVVEDSQAESGPDPTSSDAFKYEETASAKAAAPSTSQDMDFTPTEVTHRKEFQPSISESQSQPNTDKRSEYPPSSQEIEEITPQIDPIRPINLPSGPHFSSNISQPLVNTKSKHDSTDPTPAPDMPTDMDIDDSEVPSDKSIWSQYQRITQSSAQELCEQLRIVLEPTKANSLQGDYKTGKRINMKKVIGYIASRFRKDKIWLRRTRNSAREYQILLAIDDSFSMSEHDLGISALKGLCVLIQALHSLEVGELAVAKIREGMKLVHEFKEQLTLEKSEEIVGQFRFDYGRKQGTDSAFPMFLQQCGEYLKEAGKAELQLVIIISDGRLNKKQVRPYLLRYPNILFLCIILDNPAASILSMQTTTFTQTAAGPQVELRPYLEDFPFAHYIVLENPNLLVHSLCDVIRQWFEFIKDLS